MGQYTNKIDKVVVEEDGVEIYRAKPAFVGLVVTHDFSAGSSSVGGSGSVTIASTPISDAGVGVGGTRSFSVASRFNASDVSAVLSYHAYVDNHALLVVESMDNAAGTFDLRSLGTAIGSATVIVKATASVGGSAVAVKTEKFTLTVTADDHDPVRTTTAWPDVSGAQTLDLSAYFNDTDGFDQLSFTATSSDASVVTATVDGSSLVLENAMTTTGSGVTATVTVTASDPNATATDTLTVTFSFSTIFLTIDGFWKGNPTWTATTFYYVADDSSASEYVYYPFYISKEDNYFYSFKYVVGAVPGEKWQDHGPSHPTSLSQTGSTVNGYMGTTHIFNFEDPYY